MNKKTISILLAISIISFPSFSNTIKSTYQTAINYVVSHGYMSSTNNNFNGDKYVTRNELAQVIYNIKSQESDWINITAKVLPNVVGIKCKDNLGSGVLLDNQYVLSCYHVYQYGEKIYVSVGFESIEGTMVAYDMINDISLIKLSYSLNGVNNLKLAKDVVQAQEIITIGNPIRNPKSVSKGIVSNLKYDTGLSKRLQFDMVANFGNSGGAVFDSNGDIVSIMTNKLNDTVGYGLSFGVSQSDLKKFLDDNFYNIK